MERTEEFVRTSVIAKDNGITSPTVSRWRREGLIPEDCYITFPTGVCRFRRQMTNDALRAGVPASEADSEAESEAESDISRKIQARVKDMAGVDGKVGEV